MQSVALVEHTEFYRVDAARKLEPQSRSALGQFMTPAPIARFMASLFNPTDHSEIRLLDPGAGVGSLTAAFVEEFCKRRKCPTHLDVTAYEIDPCLLSYLELTMTACRNLYELHGGRMTAELRSADFIADAPRLLSDDLLTGRASLPTHTHVIMNPPYKKISSASNHRRWLRVIGIEASNLYAGFVGVAVKFLSPNGELVAIIPRSFCNGVYFRSFRDLLLGETAIKHIHVFDSRTHAFKDAEVLQENLILHIVKGEPAGDVKITSSNGANFTVDEDSDRIVCEDMTERTVPHVNIVKPVDPDKFIHIATTGFEQKIVDRISRFSHTLKDLRIEVSTGPVVDFRLKEEIRLQPERGTVPLLYATHFENDGLRWPKEGKKPNAIRVTSKSEKWLWPNSGYFVVTRRFTSKEERRRIVASVYDSSLPGELVGFENHLNVFHNGRHGLPEDVAHGLSIYLNSTLLDRYFRQFNGHTQVNASDLRSLHYPDLQTLQRLGRASKAGTLQQRDVDALIDREINKMGGATQMNPVQAQGKIDEALIIVKALGLPRGQHNERSALTLLAILNLEPEQDWRDIGRPLSGITPIMEFCRDHYAKEYAPNTRETFRRQTMHQFVEAAVAVYNPDQPDRPVNSPRACYQVSLEAFEVISTFGTKQWDSALSTFLNQRETLVSRYTKEREMQMIPVLINRGMEVKLTPGLHSKLIKDVIEEFGPRYAPGSEVIYVGDTGDKDGFLQRDRFADLGVEIDRYGKLPDIVFHYQKKDWLLLVESVTSHGPMDAKRHIELAALFADAKPGIVYVTAFPDRLTMAKHLSEISWETEVWVAEAPTHLIHFDGERFLGPYRDARDA